MKGSIKKLLNGFGFISPEGESKDVFFHANDLEGVEFESLKEGDVVTFEMGQSDKGPKAEKIALVTE
ncbi:cold shock domain-containing protein [Candidatus Gracilibacteria bacterium]|nr:cold shock domain-containing protein [Candidatus Gracilibacteria bacterium]